jgi:Ala-tRNA(Pro) deacylase
MKTEEFLLDKGVVFKHHQHKPAYTAQELAAEEHVTGRQVAKTVIVKADDRFVLCVLPACYKLDLEKVRVAADAGECRMATENEMASLFPDSEIGAEPPFGNLYGMSTLVDWHLTEGDRIVFAANSHRDAIEMDYADYDRLAQPRVSDLGLHV